MKHGGGKWTTRDAGVCKVTLGSNVGLNSEYRPGVSHGGSASSLWVNSEEMSGWTRDIGWVSHMEEALPPCGSCGALLRPSSQVGSLSTFSEANSRSSTRHRMLCLTHAPAMEESWCASAGSAPEGLFRNSGRQRGGNVIALRMRMSGDVHIVPTGGRG